MDEKRFEKIEDYLNGSMSRAEQLRFEAELATNEELASDFHLYHTIEAEMRSDAAYSEEEALLRNSLKALTKKYFTTKPAADEQWGGLHNHQPEVLNTTEETFITGTVEVPANGKEQGRVKRMNTWKKLTAVAILSGVIAMGTIWFLKVGKEGPEVAVNDKKTNTQKKIIKPDTTSHKINFPSNDITQSGKNRILQEPNRRTKTAQPGLHRIAREQLEALYAKHAKPDVLPEGPNQEVPDLDANEDYKNGEYTEAIVLYEKVIKALENPEMGTRGQGDEQKRALFYACYYRAQSYIAMDSAAKAIPDLYKVINYSPDNYWKSKVQWYLALTCLRTGKAEKAEVLLKQVAHDDKGSEYKQKAVQLLSELVKREKNK